MKSGLLNTIQKTIRLKNLNTRIEQVYLQWIRQYILFHNKRHPQELSAADIVSFLMHLKRDPKTGASATKQALNALLFMYREVLHRPFEHLDIQSKTNTISLN